MENKQSGNLNAKAVRVAHEIEALKTKPTHTPTPWRMDGEPEYFDQGSARGVSKIYDQDGIFVAQVVASDVEQTRANAAFIVCAVNSHEALVQNLKSEHEFLITKAGYRHEMNVCTVCKAIAQAEGKE